jgi:hypothetical protein
MLLRSHDRDYFSIMPSTFLADVRTGAHIANQRFVTMLGREHGGGRKASQPDNFPLPPMRERIFAAFWERYSSLPSQKDPTKNFRFIALGRVGISHLQVAGYASTRDQALLILAEEQTDGLAPEAIIDLESGSFEGCAQRVIASASGKLCITLAPAISLDELRF